MNDGIDGGRSRKIVGEGSSTLVHLNLSRGITMNYTLWVGCAQCFCNSVDADAVHALGGC